MDFNKIMIINLFQIIRKFYWFILRPQTTGVRVILLDKKKQVLLVEHKYINGWFLPGGGLKKNENPKKGLARELKEELNIKIQDDPELMGIYENHYEYKKDTVYVFVVNLNEIEINIDGREIKRAKFFSLDFLPKNVSPGTMRRIQEFVNIRNKENIW